jgi:hypothetical protein
MLPRQMACHCPVLTLSLSRKRVNFSSCPSRKLLIDGELRLIPKLSHT